MTDSSQSQTQTDKISSSKSGKSAIECTLENSKKLKKLGEIIELKSNLAEFKGRLKIFNDESMVLNELYKNENNMLNEMDKKDKAFQLNDFIFEENAIKIFSDFYGLKEYILYPHFDVGLSEKKRTNVTSIFYYKINFQIGEKKESDDKEEKEAQKELAQCTFKPRLYTNKYNNRIQSQKKDNKNKSVYEKNSQWSSNLKKKKENELKKKLNKEKEGCTFNPQLTALPKYKNKKNSVSSREIIGEENYYNKMKKARQIKEEKKKVNDLVEKYDERKKKKETLPRSVVTFGKFNLEQNEISNDNMNNNIINFNIKENIINNDTSERSMNKYNNNYAFSSSISNKQTSMGNLDVSNKINNDININTNQLINDGFILNKKSESSKNKINQAIYYDTYKGSSEKKANNKIKDKLKIINLNNKYQRENNYDFDNNYLEEKFLNKNKYNAINNINFLNPTIREEKEKENANISTGTVTKASSIISLQKKSTHSLPDRPGHIENLLNFNINEYKFEKTKDNNNMINNKNINDNLQDEDFIRQKKMLMNELHNWSNYDEDSNFEY